MECVREMDEKETAEKTKDDYKLAAAMANKIDCQWGEACHSTFALRPLRFRDPPPLIRISIASLFWYRFQISKSRIASGTTTPALFI